MNKATKKLFRQIENHLEDILLFIAENDMHESENMELVRGNLDLLHDAVSFICGDNILYE